MSTEARLVPASSVIAHSGSMAAGLVVLALILIALIGLPVIVGMAISVARGRADGRWQPLAIGAIVSVCIAFVAGTAFKINAVGITAIAMGGGAALGAGIGGLVRLIRKKRRVSAR